MRLPNAQRPQGRGESVRCPARSMLPSLLFILAGIAAVFKRVELAYEEDKGEVAHCPASPGWR
jgi:hypothetical protein